MRREKIIALRRAGWSEEEIEKYNVQPRYQDRVLNTCITCRFYVPACSLSFEGPWCSNSACNEKAWSYTDPVTGDTRHYEERNSECRSARLGVCGYRGRYWESH